jgi:uncharacterized protein YgiM (DUF1202 family)
VQNALNYIRDNCTNLASGASCFGSADEPDDDLSALPANPLAGYRVAALNTPVQGGAVYYMVLMGDAALNLPPATPITTTVVVVDATANSNANLRANPDTNSEVVGNVSGGEALELIGTNQAGDWFQVLRPDGSKVWIYGPLITVSDPADLSDLPISGETSPDSGPDSPPVPSVGFRAGTSSPACPQAATGLALQSGSPVLLDINGLPLTLNGIAIITQVQGSSGSDTVMLTTLVNGEITIGTPDQSLTVNQPGATIGASLVNQHFTSLINSTPIIGDLREDEEQLTENVRQVCNNAIQTDLIKLMEDMGYIDCDTLQLSFAQEDAAMIAHKQMTDAAMDVLVCDTSQPITGSDATAADIVEFKVFEAPRSYILDVILAASPAESMANAYSYALIAWLKDSNGNSNTGLLLQVHKGVQTIGQIDRNFNVVPGTNNLISTSDNSATFTLPPDVAGFDLQSFLMQTETSPRVCDTTEFMTLP